MYAVRLILQGHLVILYCQVFFDTVHFRGYVVSVSPHGLKSPLREVAVFRNQKNTIVVQDVGFHDGLKADEAALSADRLLLSHKTCGYRRVIVVCDSERLAV